MPEDYLRKILRARVYDVARETPLDHAPLLSRRLGSEIWIKREDQQPIFAYKIRGAYNKMASLPPEALQQGVIAASAGNHAQGVALSARKLGCDATIVMPVTTPQIKIDSVKRWGARVELVGDSYDEAREHARGLCREKGLTFIHPYDDPEVIAGQGTVGFEILKQHSDRLDTIFVPVGGGGLLAGIAAYVKQIRPEVKIIGVEPEEADAMQRSLKAGRRVKLKEVGLFADGVAVRQVGRESFRLCRKLVDDVVLVNTDQICAAIKDAFEETRTILEPAGALAIAGLKRWIEEHGAGGSHVAIASGANMNFDRLRHVSERAEIGERREAVMAVTIPEKPGSFRRFCSVIGNRNISEFNYRFANPENAHIFVGVQVRGAEEIEELLTKLRRKGYDPIDLTDNEVAKIHGRHMVGGHAPLLDDERIFSFEFPERPGALRGFLDRIGGVWNISLFHYRNHGSDYGRVLCGIQVPRQDRKAFRRFLDDLGYRYQEETDNPIYQLFLA